MTTEQAPWRNRIVRHSKKSPKSLRANPRNWRTHPPEQRAAMVEMLDSVGYIQNVILNARTGNLIDGHLRVEIAMERGEKTIPVVEVDLTEEEEARVLAAYDPLSAMAKVDTDTLGDLLRSIDLGEGALDKMLADLGRRAGVAEMAAQAAEAAPRDTQWMVMIECEDEAEQVALLERLVAEGLNVRALIG